MKAFPQPSVENFFFTKTTALLDVTQGILTFRNLAMQLRLEDPSNTRAPAPLLMKCRYKLYLHEPRDTLKTAAKIPHLWSIMPLVVLKSAEVEQNYTPLIASRLNKVTNNV